MKRFLFKKTVYNCKQATMLSLKREEGKISLLERLKLSYHVRFCDPCRCFINQSHIINNAGADLSEIIFRKPLFTLTEESKENIRKHLEILDQ